MKISVDRTFNLDLRTERPVTMRTVKVSRTYDNDEASTCGDTMDYTPDVTRHLQQHQQRCAS